MTYRSLRLLVLATVAASLAVPGVASATSAPFSFASGLVSPAPLQCSIAKGCLSGLGPDRAGGLSEPRGVAFSGGELYVPDYDNQRVDVFDAAGVFQRAFGKAVDSVTGADVCTDDCTVGAIDGGPAALYEPYDVVVDQGIVFVADAADNRINAYQTDGTFLFAFGKGVGGAGLDTCTTTCVAAAQADTSAGSMDFPTGIAVGPGHVLYVADGGNQRVDAYDATGTFLRALGAGVGGGGTFACTTASGCAKGSLQTGAGGLGQPAGIAVSATGVYVSDSLWHNRINVINATDGTPVMAIGDHVNPDTSDVCTTVCQDGVVGSGAGQLDQPIGVALDGANLIVVDWQNQRGVSYNAATGAFQRAFGKNVNADDDSDVCTTSCTAGSPSSDQAGMNSPYGADAAGGTVYVADNGNNRVDEFSETTGAFSGAIGLTGGPGPCTTDCLPGIGTDKAGSAWDPEGVDVIGSQTFVLDAASNRIDVFDSNLGGFLRGLGTGVDPNNPTATVCTDSCGPGAFGSAAGGMQAPRGIVVDPIEGEAFVSDVNNHRIDVIDITAGGTAGTFLRAYGQDVGGSGIDVCTTTCTAGSTGTQGGAFDSPHGLALFAGQLYVTDRNQDRITVLNEASGAFVRAFGKDVGGNGVETCAVAANCQLGTSDHGAGGLYDPTGIDVGDDGTAYVADDANNRVDVFDGDTGDFLYAFGHRVDSSNQGNRCTTSCQQGQGPAQDAGSVYHPNDISLYGGEVYLASPDNNRVDVFSVPDGKFRVAIGDGVGGDGIATCTTTCQAGSGLGIAGALASPSAISATPGAIFVGDTENNRVDVFVDAEAPITTDNVPATYGTTPVTVTLSVTDGGGSGIDKTYYTTGTNPAVPTTASAVYDSGDKPVLAAGEKIRYFSTDHAGNQEAPHTSAAAKVDTLPPSTADDVPSTPQNAPVTVTLLSTDSGSGVARTYYTQGMSPAVPTTASSVYDPAHRPVLGNGESIRYFSVDRVGNAESPHGSVTVTVTPPVTTPTDTTPVPPPAPDNHVTWRKPTLKGSAVLLHYRVPGAGELAITAKAGNKTVGKASAAPGKASTATLRLKLTAVLRKLLHKKHKLTVKVTARFTPTGGTARSTTNTLTLREQRKKGRWVVSVKG